MEGTTREEFYVVGVDVGTGSARAALVSSYTGQVRKVAVHPIRTWKPQPEYFQQSSENIWLAVCRAVQEVVQGVSREKIKGIGFDATCSLVVLDGNHRPLSVSPNGESEQNIILWMDHRAKNEAAWINTLEADVLKYVGGSISPEMQTPKMLWLKKFMPKLWEEAQHFMDLPDYLTWRASGFHSRSLCSLVCKWTYLANEDGNIGWSEEYFSTIGLQDLLNDNCSKIGNIVLKPGDPVGEGISVESGRELGLLPGTKVATSIIDAHAGGVGLLGCNAENINIDFLSRLALICGTSTCHMALTKSPHFVKGVWGPYWSAMVPNLWLNEGGQTCTGHLIDHVIDSHPAASLLRKTQPETMHIQQYLNEYLETLALESNKSNFSFLTKNLHMWPDFHGNRSPLADPSLLGMLSGLSLTSDVTSLALTYLATVQALAYGTRHIIESLRKDGLTGIRAVLLCGGLSRNRVFVQTHADVLGLPVLCAREPESVLLGSAILASYAAGVHASVQEGMIRMGGKADVVTPDSAVVTSGYHDRKFKVFMKMVDDQRSYQQIMES